MLLQGRKAIVTGASSGIGKATAERLGREGASVCVNYYSANERAAAKRVVASIEENGVQATSIQADVSNETEVKRLVAQTVAEFGGLDLLVNNAGIEKKIPLLKMSLADWNAVINTNLTGAFLCLRESAQMMRNGGVIINISSVHEFIPWPGFAHYCASKGAIVMLAKALALDYATRGIRVNALCPGIVDTPMLRWGANQEADPEKAIERYSLEQPIGRLATPDECAYVALWLVSDEASFVTGIAMPVDGGLTAK